MTIDIKIFPFLKQLKQASGKNYMLILNWHNRKKNVYYPCGVFRRQRYWNGSLYLSCYFKKNIYTLLLFITSNIVGNEIYTLLFLSNALFSTQLRCCLSFSVIAIQILLRCCLIHITIIILRIILYLAYFCPCLGLGLFMSYLHDLCFIFSFIFIAINPTTSFLHYIL